jgi:hypothetical protein
MRNITRMLADIRRHQIAEAYKGTPELCNKKLAETNDLFAELDKGMNSFTPEATNEQLAEVMTSADFTYAIQEFVQREALPGYQRMGFAFEPLVKPDTLTNFLPATRYQKRAGLEDLEYVGEKGTARPGSVVDATKRQYQVYRWEKQFDFSMEALVNDDLSYFSDQARLMGEAARRTIEKYVSRMYTNAVTVARLVALGALYAQNGRLTSARVSECRMAFGQRVDTRNEPINADLVYIVYHRGLEDQVRTIQNSTLVPENATNAANVVRGTFIGIKDPHMAGTAPNLPWFGFVNWKDNNVIPFVLARLQGWAGPKIVRRRSNIEAVTDMLGAGTPAEIWMGDFETGNIVLKVVDVWGTYVDGTNGNLFDERGAYYSDGTVP